MSCAIIQRMSDTVSIGMRRLSCLQDRKLAREGLWAHETELPEVGGLLLARAEAPELNSDSRLCQLVIFLLEHGPNGSKGVIINRPATATVGDLLTWGYQPSQVRRAMLPQQYCRVHSGLMLA